MHIDRVLIRFLAHRYSSPTFFGGYFAKVAPCAFISAPMVASEFAAIAAGNAEAWRWLALLTVLHNDLAISVSDDLMIRDPQTRATAILLRLAGCRGGRLDLPEPAEVDVSQEALARLTNLSRTTLGEMLRKYEEAGWISQSYRRLTILAPKALREQCSLEP